MGDKDKKIIMPNPLNRKGTLVMPRSGQFATSKKMRRPHSDKMLRGPVEDKMRRPDEDKLNEGKLNEGKFANRSAFRAAVKSGLTPLTLDQYEPVDGKKFTLEEVQVILEESGS